MECLRSASYASAWDFVLCSSFCQGLDLSISQCYFGSEPLSRTGSAKTDVGTTRSVTGILTDYLRRANLRIGLWPEWLAQQQPDWPPIERLGFAIHEPDTTLSPELIAFD